MRKKILCLITLVAVITLGACSNSGNDNLSLNNEKREFIEVNVKDKELLNISEEISDLVVELYGIDDATTIVFNNHAYVAVIMAFDNQFTEELEKTIISLVKEKQTSLEGVSVSDNPKLFKQVDDLVFNLLQGKSYDSQVIEINKVASRF